MANITAQLVKELREKTGAGMMDCKKALVQTDGDLEAAIDFLREKGLSSAAKKADRIAAEGTTYILEGVKIVDQISTAIATIGEKITLRRFEIKTKSDADAFGSYLHMGGRIGVLVTLEGSTDAAAAKDVAMHIAAINPTYVSRDEVSAEEVERERKVLTEQALNEGKPENIVAKMVEGRLGKYFEDVCLLDQTFVKNSDQKVRDFVASTGGSVNGFVRYAVGEGIEKREDNFAEEVMSQVKGN